MQQRTSSLEMQSGEIRNIMENFKTETGILIRIQY
jgi:hypothetical protein